MLWMVMSQFGYDAVSGIEDRPGVVQQVGQCYDISAV
jgi:hypothetical protein